MLSIADKAIVVVGDENTRSKSMELDLFNLIRDGGLKARQALLPESCKPRLNTNILPLVSLTDPNFIDVITHHYPKRAGIKVHHATNHPGSKILTTAMRDVNVSGPALRECHRRVGQYLTIHFLASVVGIEERSITHVQGHLTSGFRLLDEQRTLIVALMRGGEPIASGVNDIIPLAAFLHAKVPDDITRRHLKDSSLVLLVDSVINNGKTVAQFEGHVRKLDPAIRIVVIAGVVQAGSVAKGSLLHHPPRGTKLDIIALRLSENKFTGRGTSDTGNRLFNTTHIP
jgi:uracil phosphoribosyltransferase